MVSKKKKKTKKPEYPQYLLLYRNNNDEVDYEIHDRKPGLNVRMNELGVDRVIQICKGRIKPPMEVQTVKVTF